MDIALFDRDWNNAIYFFLLNADEQIYMRYGGRDSVSPDTYLSLDSLELALAKGLELHNLYLEGKLEKTPRPKPLSPRELPLLVERTYARNACVECHLIGDYWNLQREQEGTLDKPAHLYRSPDIRTLGIHLDIPKGLIVKEAKGAVEAAGMKAGDRIAALNVTPVWTFADLQYYYDKVDRRARRIRVTADRGGRLVELTVDLPARWWWTDLRFRQSSVEPRTYFESVPLTEADKRGHGLRPDGFASEVNHVDQFARITKSHDLKPGDIIFAVDGADRDELADSAELHIKLRKKPGDTVMLDVIRNGERIRLPLKTYRLGFRK
jgi:hypothetical protein